MINLGKERDLFDEWIKQHPDYWDLTEYESNIMFDAWLVSVNREGYVLVPCEQLNQWGHMANYAQEYGCPECFEARGYAHSLACEINSYFEPNNQGEQ